MLNEKEFIEAIGDETPDQTIKSWLFESPKLGTDKALELIAKHRPLLARQILRELLIMYVEKVANKKI